MSPQMAAFCSTQAPCNHPVYGTKTKQITDNGRSFAALDIMLVLTGQECLQSVETSDLQRPKVSGVSCPATVSRSGTQVLATNSHCYHERLQHEVLLQLLLPIALRFANFLVPRTSQ